MQLFEQTVKNLTVLVNEGDLDIEVALRIMWNTVESALLGLNIEEISIEAPAVYEAPKKAADV